MDKKYQISKSFNASDYVITGEYVAASSPIPPIYTGMTDGVPEMSGVSKYYSTISHNGKKIYVIGCSEFGCTRELGSIVIHCPKEVDFTMVTNPYKILKIFFPNGKRVC